MKHLGIITALLPEADCFIKSASPDIPIRLSDTVSLIVSGIGQDSASTAAEKLIDEGVDGLLSAGTAGALAPGMRPGDLLIPSIILTAAGRTQWATRQWHQHVLGCFANSKMTVYTDHLLSLDRIIGKTADKHQLYTESGASAVDMESAAILAIAETHRIPALVIRSIVDPASFGVPDFILRNSDNYGRISMLALMKCLLRHPANIGTLLQLAGYFQLATRSLRYVNLQRERLLPVTTD